MKKNIFGVLLIFLTWGCTESSSPEEKEPELDSSIDSLSLEEEYSFHWKHTNQEILEFLDTDSAILSFHAGYPVPELVVAFISKGSKYPELKKVPQSKHSLVGVISHDGQYLAYNQSDNPAVNAPVMLVDLSSTNLEAQQVLAEKAWEPRWYLKDGQEGLLVSTALGADFWKETGEVLWYPFEGGSFGGAEVIYSGGSHLGGLSADGKYLAEAFFSKQTVWTDISNGETQFLHQLKFLQEDTVTALQTCNPSISPSEKNPNYMMYVDFGSPSGKSHPDLGQWGFHRGWFIDGPNMEFPRMYHYPEEWHKNDPYSLCAWDDVEWSNHPYYGVSSSLCSRSIKVDGDWDVLSTHNGIVLAQLKTGEFLRVTEALPGIFAMEPDFQWPALWIKPANSFVEETGWITPGRIE